MKIKFFSNSPVSERYGSNGFYINPSLYYLRHWYNLYGKGKVEWINPEIFLVDSLEQSVADCLAQQPDVIGFGVYTWNAKYQYSLAKKIKAALPDSVIVLGGPELTAHKTPGFFAEHPYVDFVVYGDGERPFQQIIDHKLGLCSSTEFVNIVENFNNTEKIYPYEMLKDPLYYSISPYVSQKDFIEDSIKHNKTKLGADSKFSIGVEFARGCMYKCTFCDWSQNLTKKVVRHSHSWKEDIDYFHEIDVGISETDANFGQWKDDIDAFNYALSLYDPNRNFKFIVNNTSKLKKDATEHIIRKSAEVYGRSYTCISLQDIDTTVLKNIDRPSLSWETHKTLMQNLRASMPDHTILSEFVLGLPGQSLESLKDGLFKVLVAGSDKIVVAHWIMLPNSPAADPFYQKLHKLKLADAWSIINHFNIDLDDVEDLYADIAGQGNMIHLMTSGRYVISNKDMQYRDFLVVSAAVREINHMPRRLIRDCSEEQIKKILKIVFDKAHREVDYQMAIQQPLIEKYGFIVHGQWLNKKWYGWHDD
jgi:tRNA A37 methylthiotransferase MiaB